MCADKFLLLWLRSLLEPLPGVRLLDAHTHIGGDDPDGWRCSLAELTGVLALAASERWCSR